MASNSSSSLFFACFLAATALCSAHIAEFDEAWQRRAEKARATALAAYHPDPESVNNELNALVHRTLKGNGTRGGCRATNPIDRCWRCGPNWAHHRKRLAACGLGFGRGAGGGRRGRFYVVNDPSDDNLVNPKPGTLRHAALQDEPLWIVFASNMTIRLRQELLLNSNKTLDGRGADVHVAYGAGITLQFVHHVIIHGIHVHDIRPRRGGVIRDSPGHYGLRTRSDGDGISIFGSSHIWIDHVSMARCADGLIDAINASTAVTVSNSRFTDHDEVMLFGAHDRSEEDRRMQITLAFNHFGRGLRQRMPRCRWGFFHIVNNDYAHWLMYAVGGSQRPTIISHGNRYTAPRNPRAKQVTKREYATRREWKTWAWRSDGDQMRNGAFFVESGPARPRLTKAQRTVMGRPAPGTSVPRLTRYAGALTCRAGSPC
ncbi:pectate lyase-like [Wolffia australiana]